MELTRPCYSFPPSPQFHIFAVGTEECMNSIAKSVIVHSKKEWEELLKETLGASYEMLCGHALQVNVFPLRPSFQCTKYSINLRRSTESPALIYKERRQGCRRRRYKGKVSGSEYVFRPTLGSRSVLTCPSGVCWCVVTLSGTIFGNPCLFELR